MIERNNGDVGAVSDSVNKNIEKREDARRLIALIYVGAYLFIVTGFIAVALYKNYSTQDIKDVLLAISGILSGPLGFIIGYYFKSSFQE